MLRSVLGFLALAPLLVACSDQDRGRIDEPRGDQVSAASAPAPAPARCGVEAGPSGIEAYFTRLAAHLATGDEPVPMAFYGEVFGIRSADRYLLFRRTEMGAEARALPSVEDWREISSRGQAALQNAGWRGCFLAHGKVWFEADGRGNFGMKSFNKTMPWDAPTP